MIIVLVLLMNVIGGRVFAADGENVSPRVKEAFKKEFPDVKQAKWEELGNHGIYSARFMYGDKELVAYFNKEGEMLASVRLVGKESLPFIVDRTIKKMYGDPEIIKIEELTLDGRLSYFFTIETEKSKAVVRVFSDGFVEKIRTEKKKMSKKE